MKVRCYACHPCHGELLIGIRRVSGGFSNQNLLILKLWKIGFFYSAKFSIRFWYEWHNHRLFDDSCKYLKTHFFSKQFNSEVVLCRFNKYGNTNGDGVSIGNLSFQPILTGRCWYGWHNHKWRGTVNQIIRWKVEAGYWYWYWGGWTLQYLNCPVDSWDIAFPPKDKWWFSTDGRNSYLKGLKGRPI